jgi:hypothetical protein
MEVNGYNHYALATLPQGKSPWYPPDKRLDESEPLWILWRKENFLPQSEIKPQSSEHTAYSLITILTELS